LTIYLTPFNLAVADYLKVPIIDEIDIGAYFGQIADSIGGCP